MRPLLVGEAPGRQTVGARPFTGRTGRRLERLAGVDRLYDHFDVVNLLDRWPGPAGVGSAWPMLEARVRAEVVKQQARVARRPRNVVLVGRRVAAAFGLRELDFLTWGFLGPRARVAVLPHPSGVSHWWNDPENVEAAAAFLRDLVAAEPARR